MKLKIITSLFIAGALGLFSCPAMAGEVVLQNGFNEYEGASSTIVIAGTGNADCNYGALASVLVGAGASVERRALLYFDLTSLSGTKVQEDALLELKQANVRGFERGMFEIAMYRIAPENAAWKAGNGTGKEAQDKEATWNHRSGGAIKTPWTGAPGLSKAGVDHDEQPLGIIAYEVPSLSSSIQVTIPKEVIQQWIDEPGSNAGLLFKRISSPPDARDAMGGFYSVHHPKPELRPKLVIITNQ